MEHPRPLKWFGLLLLLFLPLLWEWAGYVAQVGRLSYALLVPWLAAWLAWHHRHPARESNSPTASREDILPWLVLLLSGLIFLIGGISSVFTISVAAFPLAVIGLLGVLWGRRLWWQQRFALLMLLAMVPVPLPLLDRFTPWMVQHSGDTAVAMLRLIEPGEITWVGSNLTFRGWHVFVAEACSGSGTMLTLAVLSLLLAGLFSMRMWTLALLMALVMPLTLFVNGLRIALTAWILDLYGPAAVTGQAHELLGQLVVILAGAGLAVVVDRLSKGRSPSQATQDREPQAR